MKGIVADSAVFAAISQISLQLLPVSPGAIVAGGLEVALPARISAHLATSAHPGSFSGHYFWTGRKMARKSFCLGSDNVTGGFGSTAESSSTASGKVFTRLQFEGTVTVGGVERDVGRRVYQRHDIDFNYRDATGRTNLQRMKNGDASIGSDGRLIQLHHVPQKESGPMAEVREVTHTEYHSTLHGLIGSGGGFRNNRDLERQYANFKKKYWHWRANQYMEGRSL